MNKFDIRTLKSAIKTHTGFDSHFGHNDGGSVYAHVGYGAEGRARAAAMLKVPTPFKVRAHESMRAGGSFAMMEEWTKNGVAVESYIVYSR